MRRSGAYAWVIPDGRQFVAGTATHDTTDAAGTVALRLRAGPISGTASFELSVPAAGIADTVRVRIEPGDPVALHLGSAQDTTLRVNAGATLTAYVLDRHANRRLRDAVTFTSPEAELAVTADGRVTGLAPVRGRVVARAGALRRETTLVSVVPAGTLAVQRRLRGTGGPRPRRTDGASSSPTRRSAVSLRDWRCSTSRRARSRGSACGATALAGRPTGRGSPTGPTARSG